MNEQADSRSKAIAAWSWPAVTVAVLILLTSLVHIPSSWNALNYFDPPKRLLWALMASVLAVVWNVRTNRLGRTPLLLSFGLLTWIIFRTLLKPHPSVELEVLFTWILPILLFILAGSLDQTRGVRIVGGCLVLAGFIQACLMVMQRFGFDPFFLDTTSVMEYKPGRMVGTIGYQNQAVDFLAFSAAGMFLVGRSLCLRLGFMAAVLFVAGLTGNRGGVLAFTLALLVSQVLPICFHESWSTRRKWIVAATVTLGVCGVVAIIVLIPETRGRFREVITDYRSSPAVGSRLLMTHVGVDMFQERLWTGWGAGEYAFQYLDRLGAVLPEEKTHEVLRYVVFAREAHNDYLQFAVEFGIVGFSLLGAFLAVMIVRLARARNVCAGAVPAIAFILAYMAVAPLFSFPWQTSMGGPLTGFLLGWLWPRQMASEHERADIFSGILPPSLAHTADAAVVVVSMVLAGWFTLDAFLNIAVPNELVRGGPSATVSFLPRCAYRYRALVGAAYASQGDDIGAEKELTNAHCGYRDLLLWNNLGHVQAKLHKWREATAIYEKWVRCGLDHPNALFNLSIAYEQTGRFREAADTLVKRNTLWSDPSPADIKRLAVLQLQSGNPKSAQATLRLYSRKWTAAESRTVAEIENLAGGICLLLGEKQEAAKWFRSALEKNPDMKSARRNLEGLSNRVPEVSPLEGQVQGE